MLTFNSFFFVVQVLKKDKLPMITASFQVARFPKLSLLAIGIFIQVLASHSIAQKNNPVSGDAAQLVDFLKKDYSTISPEQREQQILRDRAKVIGIFKSYLTLDQAEGLGGEFFSSVNVDSDNYRRQIDSILDTLNKVVTKRFDIQFRSEFKLDWRDAYDEWYEPEVNTFIDDKASLEIQKVSETSLQKYAIPGIYVELILSSKDQIEKLEDRIDLVDSQDQLDAKKICPCSLDSTSSDALISKLKKVSGSYELSKEKINAVQSMEVDPTNFKTAIGFIEEMNAHKNELYRLQHRYDIDQLIKISCVMFGYEYQIKSCDSLDLSNTIDNYRNYRNRFLTDRIAAFIDKYNQLHEGSIDHFAQAGREVTLQKSTAFLGGDLAFETVIDGVSRFLAGRLKEELGVFAMDQVKKFIGKGDSIPAWEDLSILFPQTTSFVTNMDAYTPDFLGKLNQYIQDDVDHLLIHMNNYKELDRVKALIKEYPTLAYTFEALEIIPQISNISNPLDYFDIVANTSLFNEWNNAYGGATIAQYNIAQALKLSQMLAHSMTFMDGGKQQFINLALANQYGSEEDFYKLYFGFLYQQNIKYYDIEFKNSSGILQSFAMLLDHYMGGYYGIKRDVQDWTKNIGRIAELAHIVNDHVSEIRRTNKANEAMDPIQISEYIGSVLDLGEEMSKVGDKLMADLSRTFSYGPDSKDQSFSIYDNSKPYWEMGRTSNDIFKNLIQKKYGMAIIKSLELFCRIEPNLVKEELVELSEFVTKLSSSESELIPLWAGLIPLLPKLENLVSDEQFRALCLGDQDSTLNWSLAELENELGLIDYYEWVHVAGENEPMLNDFIDLVIDLQWTHFPSVSDDELRTLNAKFQQVKTILKTPEFKQLYISYLLELSEPLNELKQSLINYFTQKGHFDELEIKAVFTSVDDLTDLYFRRLLILNDDEAYGDWSDEKIARLDEMDSLIQLSAKKLLTELETVIANRINEDEKLDQNVVRIVHFFDEIARAENPEQIESAMEAFAMPSGSYAVKRNSKFNVSINAYPGLLPAYEFARIPTGDSTGFQWKPGMSLGFTAPIGLNLSWGLRRSGSIGLFVPVIDIGAATAFRFNANNDSVALLPKFSFANILAPGAYVSYGFRNAPISLNFGVQFGPQLRSIKVSEEQTLINSYRVGLGVTVDIPIFNLHTRAYESIYANPIKSGKDKAETKAQKEESKAAKKVEKDEVEKEEQRLKKYDEYLESGQKAYDEQEFDVAIDKWKIAATVHNTNEIQAKIKAAQDAKARRNPN